MAIDPDNKPYWLGEEWSIEGEIRIPSAQEDLALGYLLYDEDIKSN